MASNGICTSNTRYYQGMMLIDGNQRYTPLYGITYSKSMTTEITNRPANRVDIVQRSTVVCGRPTIINIFGYITLENTYLILDTSKIS